jgi:hypothetical protein
MSSTEAAPTKAPRFRSPPYPAFNLSKAIERAAALYPKSLHHHVAITVLASAWDYAEKSSGLFAAVAALKQFNLLADEGSGDKRRFRLTESAIRIVRDQDPNSVKRNEAIKAAALAPKIHLELWEKYGPDGLTAGMDTALKGYLTLDRSDDGAAPFSDSAAEDVLAEYRQTMEFGGFNKTFDKAESANEETGHRAETQQTQMQEDERQKPASADVKGQTDTKSPVILNDIRVEFSNGRVNINAILDLRGIEVLESKLAAFKIILS